MGRCGSCRSQTQHFCFVHQEFVCEPCLISDHSPLHTRCVVNTYRKWVQDSSYDWPPKCAACSQDLQAEQDTIRRACMHVEHASCVQKSRAPQHACASCKAPLQMSLGHGAIGEAIARRIRGTPALATLLPEVERLYPEDKAPRGKAGEQVGTGEVGGEGGVLERQNEGLSVTETDAGRNISRMGTENGGKGGHGKRTGRDVLETRVEVGEDGVKGSGKWEKWSRGDVGGTMMRRGLKKGGRVWMDLKKRVGANRRRVAVGILFVVCVVLIVVLMRGQDEEGAGIHVGESVVEEMSLPNVRVNPTLLREARERARLYSEGGEGENREDVTGVIENAGRVEGNLRGVGGE